MKNEQLKIDIIKGLITQRINELKDNFKRLKNEAKNEQLSAIYRDYAEDNAKQTLSALNELEQIITLF